MTDEYEIWIEDLNPPKKKGKKNAEVSKATIQRVINARLKNSLRETQKAKGLEIEVTEEWTDVLHKDGTILRDYQDIGWKVMWYNIHSLGPGRGDLVRSWLSFRSEANVSKER
tara:strand:+ start:281 stop:619 length:339 start_codon:yes stop_codon:yes gene_type:complete